MKKMLVIKMNGQVEERENTGLKSLQSVVAGWIEAIDLEGGATMYCNADGKYHGLSVNLVATRLYEEAHGKGTNIVLGDVVVVGHRSPSGEIDGEDYDYPARVSVAACKEAAQIDTLSWTYRARCLCMRLPRSRAAAVREPAGDSLINDHLRFIDATK